MSGPVIRPSQEIVQDPHPVLRMECDPLNLKEIGSHTVEQLISHMWLVLRAAPGVGLAAPQVAVPICLAVIEDREKYLEDVPREILEERQRQPVPAYTVMNPHLELIGSDKETFFEGCLSIPDRAVAVDRARTVRLQYLDTHGTKCEETVSGWHARILQHEVDHLNGTLIIDRASTDAVVSMDDYMTFWRLATSAQIAEWLA